jgi:D-alanine-D-alanine ligase
VPENELRVGVAFGGRSVEHDVSIITALQAMAALEERHAPVPIYIARSGRWYTGETLKDLATYQHDGGDPAAEEIMFDLHGGRLLRVASASGASASEGGSALRPPWRSAGARRAGVRRAGGRGNQSIELDAVVLATHGTQGEDGCLQGALELARVPYVGPPVGAAAAAMDKAMTKALLAQAGLPALPHITLRRERWEADRETCRAWVRDAFDFGAGGAIYVKPASLGSSVGVSRCEDEAALADALELALELDRVCIVEPAAEGGIEVNCAVIGRPGVKPRASVCEQPVATDGLLSFEDKYMRSGKAQGMKSAQRLIPAPISDELTEQVQELACAAFAAFGCAGVTRVDFLIDEQERVWINELNTIPGSFSFYLWEPAGLPFADLLDELLDLAMADHAEQQRTTTVFDTNLLALRGAGGAKTGEKG